MTINLPSTIDYSFAGDKDWNTLYLCVETNSVNFTIEYREDFANSAPVRFWGDTYEEARAHLFKAFENQPYRYKNNETN